MPKCKPHTVYIYDVLSKNGDIKMNLAEKLIYLRKKQGLTQLELAEKLDVSRQAVSRWEGGYAIPNTENLKVLGKLYNVSIDYFFSDIDATTDAVITQNKETIVAETNHKHKSKLNYRGVAIYVIAIGIIASIAFGIVKSKRKMMPLEELETGDKNNYTTYTFSFE